MKIQFQKVRTLMASLIGNPNVPEAMVAELDSAIKGDEASTEEMLASATNVSQTATTETETTAVAETVTPEKTAVVAVTETTNAPVQVVEPQGKTGLELVIEKMTAIENRQLQVETENKQLRAENAELRAGASPRGIVPVTENQANVAPARVSRTSEKDEKRAEEVSRLKEKFPELMHDIE